MSQASRTVSVKSTLGRTPSAKQARSSEHPWKETMSAVWPPKSGPSNATRSNFISASSLASSANGREPAARPAGDGEEEGGRIPFHFTEAVERRRLLAKRCGV